MTEKSRDGAAPAPTAPAAPARDPEPPVLRLNSIDRMPLYLLLARYGMELRLVAPQEDIPGSYWGESEAGLVGAILYARLDTPLHSVLHEVSHYICMSAERRAGLVRDAGGDDAEECAVCVLQVLLAGELAAVGSARMLDDMDAWGYTFRLGSARRWFEEEAGDARIWLRRAGVLDAGDRPTGATRC